MVEVEKIDKGWILDPEIAIWDKMISQKNLLIKQIISTSETFDHWAFDKLPTTGSIQTLVTNGT